MKKFAVALASAVFAMSVAGPVLAKDKVIGVSGRSSRKNAGRLMKPSSSRLSKPMATSTSLPTPRASAAKQTDRRRIADLQGANVLLIVPYDSEAILPAVEKAKSEGIPMIAYDVQIEDPAVLYMTFDNVGVAV